MPLVGTKNSVISCDIKRTQDHRSLRTERKGRKASIAGSPQPAHKNNKTSKTAAEWRRDHARSPQPAHKSSNLNPLGPPGGPGRFSKEIDTKHMCFIVESGPCPTGSRTKTLRRRLFGVKRIEFKKSKTKSLRKAIVAFRQFEDVRSGMAARDAGEEEENVYI